MTLSNSLGSVRHTQSAITQKHTHTHTSVWQLCEVTCVFAVLQACCHTKTLRSLEEAHLSQRPVNKILSCHSQQARIFLFFFIMGGHFTALETGKCSRKTNSDEKRRQEMSCLKKSSCAAALWSHAAAALHLLLHLWQTAYCWSLCFYFCYCRNSSPRDQILIRAWWITRVWIRAQAAPGG